MLGFTKKNLYEYEEEALWDKWFATISDVPLVNEQSSEIALYNANASRDVFLNMNGPSGSVSILGLGTDDESFTGTLISAGDIYINADAGETLTYTGNIISEKNIYFIGTGTKTIVYNELEIYKAINEFDELKTFYNTSDDPIVVDGKRLSRTSTSKDPAFDITIVSNNAESEKVRLNYVSDAQTDGTNITDSNSIIINNWRETN